MINDPWIGIESKFPLNSSVMAMVTNLTDYGFFAEIEQGVEGLVHVSEIDWTNKNDEIAKKLASFGRSSIPLYVYYSSENAEPILLPEILTENIIKDYLR